MKSSQNRSLIGAHAWEFLTQFLFTKCTHLGMWLRDWEKNHFFHLVPDFDGFVFLPHAKCTLNKKCYNVCPYAGNIFAAKKVYIYTVKNTVFFPCKWDEFFYYLFWYYPQTLTLNFEIKTETFFLHFLEWLYFTLGPLFWTPQVSSTSGPIGRAGRPWVALSAPGRIPGCRRGCRRAPVPPPLWLNGGQPDPRPDPLPRWAGGSWPDI